MKVNALASAVLCVRFFEYAASTVIVGYLPSKLKLCSRKLHISDTLKPVAYVADAEALEFRESLDMPEEDYEFIEQAYDALTDEEQDEMPVYDV